MQIVIPIVWALGMFATRFVDPLLAVFAVAITMMIVVVWRDRRLMRALFRVTPRIAMLSAVATVVMVAVTYAILPLLAGTIPAFSSQTGAIYARFLGHGSLLLVIAAVVSVVIAEEVLWRGKVQQGIGSWSVIGAAAIYAIAHVPAGSLLLVIAAFICGCYWSALRAVSGSLVPSLCAHLVWDVVLIFLLR